MLLRKICPHIPAPRLKGFSLQDPPASSLRLAISQSSPNSSTVHSCEPVDKIGQKDVSISLRTFDLSVFQDKLYCLLANVGHIWKDFRLEKSIWYIISTEFLICRIICGYPVEYESLPLKAIESSASTKWLGDLNSRSTKRTAIILPKTSTKTNDPWHLSVSPNCLGLPPSISHSWVHIPYSRPMTSIECINGCCHYRRGQSGFRCIAWHLREKLLFAFWIPSELRWKAVVFRNRYSWAGWGGKAFESWIGKSCGRGRRKYCDVNMDERIKSGWIFNDALFGAWADVVSKGWNRHICIRRESRKTQYRRTWWSHSHFEKGLLRVFCGSRYLKTAMKRGISKSRIFH